MNSFDAVHTCIVMLCNHIEKTCIRHDTQTRYDALCIMLNDLSNTSLITLDEYRILKAKVNATATYAKLEINY